jgi:hypothetical protein
MARQSLAFWWIWLAVEQVLQPILIRKSLVKRKGNSFSNKNDNNNNKNKNNNNNNKNQPTTIFLPDKRCKFAFKVSADKPLTRLFKSPTSLKGRWATIWSARPASGC